MPTIPNPDTTHPAQRVSYTSVTCVEAKDKEAWLALFADDAIVQDPVGPSPFDPKGEGHRGKAGIARFWDVAIATGNRSITVRESYPALNSCANLLRIVNTIPGGREVTLDFIAVYEIDAAGKITSLKAYWEFATVLASLKA